MRGKWVQTTPRKPSFPVTAGTQDTIVRNGSYLPPSEAKPKAGPCSLDSGRPEDQIGVSQQTNPLAHHSAPSPLASYTCPGQVFPCHIYIRIHTISACTEIFKVTQPESRNGHISRCLGPGTDHPLQSWAKSTGIQIGRCKQ